MKRTLLLALVAGALVTAWTSITLVKSGERAIVRRFGRVLQESPRPGLHLALPWGIDRVQLINVAKVRVLTIGFTAKDDDPTATPPGQLLTGDHNLVNVQAEIEYRVQENQVERFALHEDRVDGLLARLGETVLVEWIASRPVDAILLEGKGTLPEALRSALQKRIDPYELGVQIERVSVPMLNPPDGVRDAFDRVAQAQTNRKTRANQAKRQADANLSDAETRTKEMERKAQVFATQHVSQALGEAEDFLKRRQQFRELTQGRDPQKVIDAIWLDQIARLFTSMRQSARLELLDQIADGFNLMQFPFASPRKP